MSVYYRQTVEREYKLLISIRTVVCSGKAESCGLQEGVRRIAPSKASLHVSGSIKHVFSVIFTYKSALWR
jgi:hypothetical protein